MPFASPNGLFNLSKLSVWWLRLGIAIERIKPGHPQQNGRHERMHLEGRRPANVNRVLPINFCGGPDEIVAQLKQCHEQIGAGVVDLSFQTPGSEDPGELMEALELFGKKVLPHIRDV